jgi:sortase A
MIALRAPLSTGFGVALWPRGGLAAHARAALAQPLLDLAWRRTQRGAIRARPWPWTEAWPIARLTAPGLGGWSYVLADALEDDLACGAGHLPGTARPGAPGNSVVVGGSETPARFLQLLAADQMTLEAAGGPSDFRVIERRIVAAGQIQPQPTFERPMLTLIASYPFDGDRAGAQRYVATAIVQG